VICEDAKSLSRLSWGHLISEVNQQLLSTLLLTSHWFGSLLHAEAERGGVAFANAERRVSEDHQPGISQDGPVL
jgi:hypothetical protein